jgi:hypothetical protein
MFVCKICKGQPRGAAAIASSNVAALTYNDDSNDCSWEDGDLDAIAPGVVGRVGGMHGKGKPMAFPGKRGRRGFGMVGAGGFGRSRSYAGSTPGYPVVPVGGGGPNKPSAMSTKKRAAEALAAAAAVRRRGRQPKIRGMVGLQVRNKRRKMIGSGVQLTFYYMAIGCRPACPFDNDNSHL